MSEGLVSLIISAYNAEDTIAKAIGSALKQTYENIEIIIVDDCSSDNTLEVSKKFISEKVRVISNAKNSGPYYCKNYAISVSNGEYVTFLDADDWIDDKHVEILKESFENIYDTDYYIGTSLESKKNKIKMVFSGAKKFVEINGKLTPFKPKNPNIKTINYGPYKGEAKHYRIEGSIFFKKDLINEFGGFHSSRFASDTEFIERVGVLYGPQETRVTEDRVTYNILVRKNSLSTSAETGMASKPRKLYVSSYRSWHDSIGNLLKVFEHGKYRDIILSLLKLNFPQGNERPFVAPLESLCNNNTLATFHEVYSDEKPPAISIVMQSFLSDYPGSRSNPEEKFIRAVYSVILQDDPDWELIIISDGCDITERLYNNYFKNYSNISFKKVAKPKNTEMYSESEGNKMFRGTPRAKGVSMACGNWICYLDSDDVFTRDAVTQIKKAIAEEPDEIRYIFNQTRIENSSYDHSSLKFGPIKEITGLPSSWKTSEHKNKNAIIKSTSTLIHRNGFPSHSWGDSKEEGLSEDNVFINKIIKNGNEINQDNIKLCRLKNIPYYVRCNLSGEWDF